MKGAAAMFMIGTLLLAATLGVLAQEARVPGSRGERLFFAEGCYGCHTIGAMGTPLGPDLSRVGLRYTADQLARWLADPERERPGAHMPQLELDPRDIEALSMFLVGLRGPS
ncbi:MAG: cytochrome c [Candidatus Rokubacteria bacterium]|nr:cytochrome c [Candidatus Rokubacteria bacterium]